MVDFLRSNFFVAGEPQLFLDVKLQNQRYLGSENSIIADFFLL